MNGIGEYVCQRAKAKARNKREETTTHQAQQHQLFILYALAHKHGYLSWWQTTKSS